MPRKTGIVEQIPWILSQHVGITPSFSLSCLLSLQLSKIHDSASSGLMPLIPGRQNSRFVDVCMIRNMLLSCQEQPYINTKTHKRQHFKWSNRNKKTKNPIVFVLSCELCSPVGKICGVANSLYHAFYKRQCLIVSLQW